ncbi:MAG: hypothetical protein JW873_01235 [Candidatus Saganbacteria bacterium]|nr:hypothetical protein [Candidatus Saganbacteria bacterium]
MLNPTASGGEQSPGRYETPHGANKNYYGEAGAKLAQAGEAGVGTAATYMRDNPKMPGAAIGMTAPAKNPATAAAPAGPAPAVLAQLDPKTTKGTTINVLNDVGVPGS